jgi:hypothetical protein
MGSIVDATFQLAHVAGVVAHYAAVLGIVAPVLAFVIIAASVRR